MKARHRRIFFKQPTCKPMFLPGCKPIFMPVLEVLLAHGHNLDLNRGLPVSADVPRGKNNVGEGNPHLPFYHGRRSMVESSYWLPNGQALCGQLLPSSQSLVWPGAPVGVPTIHVVKNAPNCTFVANSVFTTEKLEANAIIHGCIALRLHT